MCHGSCSSGNSYTCFWAMILGWTTSLTMYLGLPSAQDMERIMGVTWLHYLMGDAVWPGSPVHKRSGSRKHPNYNAQEGLQHLRQVQFNWINILICFSKPECCSSGPNYMKWNFHLDFPQPRNQEKLGEEEKVELGAGNLNSPAENLVLQKLDFLLKKINSENIPNQVYIVLSWHLMCVVANVIQITSEEGSWEQQQEAVSNQFWQVRESFIQMIVIILQEKLRAKFSLPMCTGHLLPLQIFVTYWVAQHMKFSLEMEKN